MLIIVLILSMDSCWNGKEEIEPLFLSDEHVLTAVFFCSLFPGLNRSQTTLVLRRRCKDCLTLNRSLLLGGKGPTRVCTILQTFPPVTSLHPSCILVEYPSCNKRKLPQNPFTLPCLWKRRGKVIVIIVYDKMFALCPNPLQSDSRWAEFQPRRVTGIIVKLLRTIYKLTASALQKLLKWE